MKICYVGDNIYGKFAFNRASKKMNVEYVNLLDVKILTDFDGSIAISELTDSIISINAEFYIMDLDLFSDDEEEIVSGIYKIKKAVNSKIIVHAPRYHEESKILIDLRALGITDIITAEENQGIMEEGLIEAVNSADTKETLSGICDDILERREKTVDDLLEKLPNLKECKEEKKSEIEKIIESKQLNSLKIAVVGSQRRIGTTTVALQLTKYFNSKEDGSAVYIEMNDNEYVKGIYEYFDCDKYSEELSLCFAGGVPLFFEQKNLPYILNEGYQFYIYDYGDLSFASDLSGIYEKDIVMLVGGIKANEIANTTKAIEEFQGQENVYYVMNFVPERSKDMVKEFMEDASEKTYFMEFTFDPFVLVPGNIKSFEDIIKNMKQPKKKLKKSKLRRIFK